MTTPLRDEHVEQEPEEEEDRTRAFYEAEGNACLRSPLCQLIGEHEGSCDPRTELERSYAIIRLIDLCDGDDTALPAMVEADAVLAMRVALAGGRP